MQTMADEKIINTLISSVRNGKTLHSYLFIGEKGLHKRETAYYFASALLCENRESAPCGKCINCIQAESFNNPDIIKKSLADITTKKSIGVDEIRQIIEDVYVKPFKSDKKIYIFEDGDALTDAAQNALLKVIEEPPEYAVFIFCVTDESRILDTVISRCVNIRFFPSSKDNIRGFILKNYPDKADMTDIIESLCEGRIEKAEDMLSGDFLSLRCDVFDSLRHFLLSDGEPSMLSAYANLEKYLKTKDSPDRTDSVLSVMTSFLTDLLKLSGGSEIINKDYKNQILTLYDSVGKVKIAKSADIVAKAEKMMSANVSGGSILRYVSLGIYYL